MPQPVVLTDSSARELSLLGALYNYYLPSAAASTNAVNVKVTAGTVFGFECKNNAAYDVFVAFYDKASVAPVPGTDTPRKKVIVPAGKTVYWSAPAGIYCANGIGLAVTKLGATLDATVLVAADVTALSVDYA